MNRLEDVMIDALSNSSREDIQKRVSWYKTAKAYLEENIFTEIKGVETELTDHSIRHVTDVMERAYNLIETELYGLNPMELYILCLSVLFHDVGNINGRSNHNQKIGEIFSRAMNAENISIAERRFVFSVVKAHCGESRTGDQDTLYDFRSEKETCLSYPIRLRDIAAILRFADELAEGPQRTSSYMIARGLIRGDARKYHNYASVTTIEIDKFNGRIVLTYEIDINKFVGVELKELLDFIWIRILKLDKERRYCKYYSPILDNFKKTEAQINFMYNHEYIELDLNKVVLDDKFYPLDESQDVLTRFNSKWNITNIIESINQKLNYDEKSV